MNRKRNRKPRREGKKEPNNVKDNARLTDTGALSKAGRYADERERRDCFKSKENDAAWYAQNAQLMNDYASFPFGIPLGTPLPSSLGLRGRGAVPGVMALYYAPMIGKATAETDPINIASRNIYSFVRHANSGHTNYDSPDLMLYLIAMDSVYMFHSYMKRLLGIIGDYTPVNRYYPATLIRAMGVQPDDLMSNISNFRGFVNQYAVQIGSMCVPNSMSYMARHTWMTEGLYTDSTAQKAQTYMYVPYQYFKFQAIQSDDTAVGSLERVNFFDPDTTVMPSSGVVSDSALKTTSDIISFAQALIQPIVTNEDLNIMSGDILKAFGPEGVVKIAGVLDGYMVLPVYSQEVLSQIENSVIADCDITGTITQNTAIGGGYITDQSTVTLHVNTGSGSTIAEFTVPDKLYNALYGDRPLNFHHSAVQPAEVMVATRLTVSFNSLVGATASSAKGVPATIAAVGSELVTHGAIFLFSIASNGSQSTDVLRVQSAYPVWDTGTNNGFSVGIALGTCAHVECFDWHPTITAMFVSFSTGGTASVSPARGLLWDADNYTIVTPDNLYNLHTAALLSQFSVPQMGAFSTKI